MGLLDNTNNIDYYKGSDFGNYQFTSLDNIINQFMVAYVGEDKVIPKAKRIDVAFHAQRALAELSFDTLKSFKAEQIVVPPSLKMILPQDYVNYSKLAWVDASGIKHPLYPTKHTENPQSFYQDSEGKHTITAVATTTKDSNVVVLDDDYSGILVHGMRVLGSSIAKASYIHNITTTSGITSITLENKNGNADKKALFSTNEQIEITRFNYLGFGRRLSGQTLIETTATAVTDSGSDNKNVVTVASVTGIEVGMFINHPAFVNNNDVELGQGAIRVVGVGTSTVELSHPIQELGDHTVAINDTIGFVSDNKDSTTWSNYKSTTPSENNNDDYEDNTYWLMNGERYGLEPSHAQLNGSFYIDQLTGLIHFSSNLAGKTVILDYISDSLGTDEEMQVHKFAEEAMYKSIAHAIISTSSYGQQLAPRFKKEKFAAVRQAKLRLSNLKLEELTQILRGKSKQIKH